MTAGHGNLLIHLLNISTYVGQHNLLATVTKFIKLYIVQDYKIVCEFMKIPMNVCYLNYLAILCNYNSEFQDNLN